ncbi:MAG: citrate (Si)-synthase, eukaryotic [Bacteroidales bacterium]|jgi:citrate synthase|nr:citrate (Si)-synthase, eukaryotic [Bacteroidales bacterium]MDD2569867.1 citrate (Si)-synthase, eukaryotic [Bacteroidales bacterium]MDD2811787.1 citrate (Si)-synthase, eukaryotic [Bacteroidales bacterium]MDD3384698.1 citrate (Si)-synthase, eukaryotic [Bacteroidales bacterium]MDD3870913.1 citrate (Si)-synthase, eukaryotic [Bacteroidales bacterium]
MGQLKKIFIERALPKAEIVKTLKNEHGNMVIGEVTIAQVLSGMKGVVSLLTCTSKLDPEEGIRFRGYTIPELQNSLPKINPEGEPIPEGLFYLMLMDELPTEEDVLYVQNEWTKRAHIPKHVFDVIDALPRDTHPMNQFVAGIVAMAGSSKFMKAYESGISKSDYWDSTYEGVMDLIARIPRIAAYVYRHAYHNDQQIEPDPELDWAGNLAHMMGYDSEEVKRLMRLYMVIHADHEGGNVSAHTTHLVGSALSSPYQAYAAGMLGLAGPLHGLANQEVVKWILDMNRELGTDDPSKEQIAAYVERTLEQGRVVPGYGHAVLRKTDPRYVALREFSLKYLPDDQLFKVVGRIYEVVPPILGNIGKIKNPWPNVDAHSGVLLLHYGIKEFEFYTVLFAVSRALGVLAQLVWDRVYGLPIERPKSQNTRWFVEKAGMDSPIRF